MNEAANDEEEMDVSPDVQGTIASTRSRRIEWIYVLGELIDNAFDAGATTVDIEIAGKSITVSDNGGGCGDFKAMLTMGKHARQKTTRLGRWGVGLKDAAWWVYGPTDIQSVHAGVQRTLRISWDSLSRWKLPRPFEQPADGMRGTRIRFPAIDRKFPEGKAFADLVAEIGFIYTPALKSGKQISFRRGKQPVVLAQRYTLPPMDSVVDTTVVVDGKKVRVHVGSVTGENPRPGINYVHEFRVIIPATALGCGGHGCRNIAGWVSLDDSWTLTRNKDDVSLHKEELGEAVFGAIRDVVIKASQSAMSFQSASLAARLTSAFRNLSNTEREKRESTSHKSGRVEPRNTARRRLNFDKTQPGGSGSGTSAGKVTIEFGPVSEGAIGRVDYDGGVIVLAENHPSIVEAQRTENDLALLFVAVLLFVGRDCDSGTSLFSFVRDGSVSRRVEGISGRLLAEYMENRAPIRRIA